MALISIARPFKACLKELKDNCLYLHFDGTRYCFKKDPNVTLLVEQEVEVGRSRRRAASEPGSGN